MQISFAKVVCYRQDREYFEILIVVYYRVYDQVTVGTSSAHGGNDTSIVSLRALIYEGTKGTATAPIALRHKVDISNVSVISPALLQFKPERIYADNTA